VAGAAASRTVQVAIDSHDLSGNLGMSAVHDQRHMLQADSGQPVTPAFPDRTWSVSCDRSIVLHPRICSRKEALMAKLLDADEILHHASPVIHQQGHEIQPFGHLVKLPIALSESACRESVDSLDQLLADTITLRDMYKKHHWQVSGPTFYQLHLLFDKHYEEQNKLVDAIAERIQLLGGISIAMAHDVAETTLVPRPPKGREPVPVQISRLLHAHEIVLKEARTMARLAAERDDQGTNDLLVSGVIRTNEIQVWFVAEHVVDTPIVRVDGSQER
jgi:starvation-inducible DNA-binding protein